MGKSSDISPFSLPNVRRFIAFRVLFNARFYYPVFTILFLDYGLSLEQFALLNTVWAVTIVLAEVPSGALADLLGRRRLLVATSLLMVMEMSIIALVPLGNGTVIFIAFLLNRILSGLAEAMAGGITPKTKERMVILMARQHGLAAFRADSIIGTPLSRCSLATSTMRMAFLHERPISSTSSAWAKRSLSRPAVCRRQEFLALPGADTE